jgi:hypothetical protein
MELELEGNLVLERRQTRRWVAIVAVVVPVVACVCAVAWFIRAFVAPPMAVIPNSMQLAAAPPEPRGVMKAEAPAPASEPAPEPPQQAAVNEPAASAPPDETPAAPAALPMVATLSAAPPSFESAPAFADPGKDGAFQKTGEQTAALEPSEPIAGPVPLPRSKPHATVAAISGPVPLPRPRPATDSAPGPTPDLPDFERHGAE